MFNTSCDVFDTRRDNEVNNKSLDADYLLNDLSSSLNAISSQFSALMSSHNRISDMYSYIKLYGVDRACVQVYNRDGLLTDLSNGVVPATEDYCESNVSKYTIACMEGLGEAIIKIFKWCWEKLKAIGKWIGEKVVAAFNWILSIFKSEKKKEMTIGEAIEELSKVKGEAKAKMDEIIKRFNASSSSNKITGVEDMKEDDPYTREPQLGPYTSREWYENECASKVMDGLRDIYNSFCFWWKANKKDLASNLKKINTFTRIIDSYGDAADDDSKFEEAYKRAMSETAENHCLSNLKGRTGEDYAWEKDHPTWTDAWTGKTHPNKYHMDVKENLKAVIAKLKVIAANPLRFADFNDLKNSFDKQRSLRSQFEDITIEAKSFIEQTKTQMEDIVKRESEVAAKLRKVTHDDYVKFGRFDNEVGYSAKRPYLISSEHKEFIKNKQALDNLRAEMSELHKQTEFIEGTIRVATGMTKYFYGNICNYDKLLNELATKMGRIKKEDE